MTSPTDIASVARDLVEMGDVFEARCLLEELPNRHDVDCPACGAMGRFADYSLHFQREADIRDRGVPGSPCREIGFVACRFCSGKGERTVYGNFNAYNDPRSREVIRCTECHGTGQREQEVDMLVPHESRLMGARR